MNLYKRRLLTELDRKLAEISDNKSGTLELDREEADLLRSCIELVEAIQMITIHDLDD
jgi:hypothetical protein